MINMDYNSLGDWGLGIGDWAQSPIPNPQSPKKSKIKCELKNSIILTNLYSHN